jgi:putative flippase GtrA
MMPNCPLTHALLHKLMVYFKEARSFIVVGTSNTVITYIIYIIINMYYSYTIAFTVSFGIGILYSAFWNSRVSFATPLTAKRLTVFAIFCVINYFIGLQTLKFLIENLSINESVAPLVAIILLVPLSFFVTRLALVGSLATSAGRGVMDANKKKY